MKGLIFLKSPALLGLIFFTFLKMLSEAKHALQLEMLVWNKLIEILQNMAVQFPLFFPY